jgi:WD40 repeat protein
MGSGSLRQGGAIRALAFSADCKLLASGAVTGLRVWDARTGTRRRRFGRGAFVSLALAFSPDGTTLTGALGDREQECRVLEVATGRERKRLALGAKGDSDVAVSPGGKLVASVGRYDPAVRVWALATGKVVGTIPVLGERGHPRHASLSAGGKVAIANAGDTIRVYEASGGKVLLECKRAGAAFVQTTFSPDGGFLASICDEDSAVSIWDLATGKERHRLAGTRGAEACAFSPDGRLLATGGQGASLVLWEVKTGKEVRRLGASPSGTALAFRPDGKVLAAGTNEGLIGLWDVGSGRRVEPSAYPTRPVLRVQFSADGKRLLGSAGDLVTWDSATGKEVRRLRDAGSALSADGTLLARASLAGTIVLASAATGKRVGVLEGHPDEPATPASRRVWKMVFSPDGRRLISGAEDRTIRVWDVAKRTLLHELEVPDGAVHELAVSPDGRWLASGGVAPRPAAGAVRLWDLEAGRRVRSFDLPRGVATGLAFSPDGKRLAAAVSELSSWPGSPGRVVVWEVPGGKEWRSFEAHKGHVMALAFSPDGRMLATGGFDRTLRLWELATSRQRRLLAGHEAMIDALAFSPDGRRLAACSADAPVYVWGVLGAGKRLGPADLVSCWEALAGEDAGRAFEGVGLLAGDPARALPYLRARLKPLPVVSPARLRTLLAGLDADDFAARRKAAAELERVADAAADALRAEQGRTRSPEVRRTLERILEGLDSRAPRQVRVVRAVEAVEWMGTPEALRLLGEWAAGAPDATLTREARAARERLRKTAKSTPRGG